MTGSRELLKEELGYSEAQLGAVESALESLEDSFDSVKPTEGEYVADIDTQGREVILRADEELSLGNLAYLAAEARIAKLDHDLTGDMGEMGGALPTSDPFEQDLYTSFTGYLAKNEMEPFEVPEDQRERLRDTREIYREVRGKVEEETGIETREKNLHQDLMNSVMLEDSELKEEFQDAIHSYHEARREVLAPIAAQNYGEIMGSRYEVSEFLNPDEDLYSETMEYIEETESMVLSSMPAAPEA
ncbi:MAG: hypothetical protein ABEK01_00030 [Candidatus Nanohaloarchaea archaeon]